MKLILILLIILSSVSCEQIKTLGNTSLASQRVLLSWSPSPEAPVNQAGGGFKVLIGGAGVTESNASVIYDLPYVSGSSPPTSITVYGLQKGNYYFRVRAYSALTDYQGNQAESELSDPVGFEVEGP